MTATVVIPIYNDWVSLRQLLRNLDQILASLWELHIVVIDDASTELRPVDLTEEAFAAIRSVTCLRLKCNLGHQRAIATALAWIGSTENARPVVIMDGDGEDRPSDVPRLLNRFVELDGKIAVFAERTKRSESFTFKQFYRLYRWAHRVMIGFPVKIGNFSVLPPESLQGLIVSNYLWYHYAATVVRTRTPFTMLKTSRGNRYAGTSKMNYVSLVRHGISAIAVHAEVLSVRLLIASFIFTCAGLLALCVMAWIRFETTLAIPGWATTVTGLVAILLVQILSVAFTFAMQSIAIHGNTGLIPVRDCPLFLRCAEGLMVRVETEVEAIR